MFCSLDVLIRTGMLYSQDYHRIFSLAKNSESDNRNEIHYFVWNALSLGIFF